MLEGSIFDFLLDLRVNNNREWFAEQRQRFLEEKAKFEDFLATLIAELASVDERLQGLQPKDCMFRIYRDTRFAKDKTPYKTNFGASFNPQGKKIHAPGYYFHCAPGEIFFGGGIYMPEKDALLAIRREIAEFGDDVQAILDAPAFQEYYGGLEEHLSLKNPPKGFDADHKHIRLLKMTSFVATRSFSEHETFEQNFVAKLRRGAEVLQPFMEMLEYALQERKHTS